LKKRIPEGGSFEATAKKKKPGKQLMGANQDRVKKEGKILPW